jgi:hypothetical protein
MVATRPADQQRKNQQAGITQRAGHPGGCGNLVLAKQVGRHRDHCYGERLMREAAQAEQRDGRIGASYKSDKPHAQHEDSANNEGAAPGVDDAEAESLLDPVGHQPAEEASEIRRQKGHPCKQGNVLQVHVADGAQIQRKPETQRAPGRIGKETRNRDAPEVALRQDFPNRWPRSVALQVCLLTGRNELPFVFGERVVTVRRFIEQ